MQFSVHYEKSSDSLTISLDAILRFPKFKELMEEYKEIFIRDFHVSFDVDEESHIVYFCNLENNDSSHMSYNNLSAETLLIWVHNVAAMLENVRYTEVFPHKNGE